ncbi:MAG TPA: GspE/PulE family protein [Gemmatimonadaceae bacterium]|nr:GspE/PulE family protein [Gemmatimonadaceae bacterium]
MTDLLSVERMSNVLTAPYLEHHGIFPLTRRQDCLTVGTWLPEVDVQALDDLRLHFDCDLELIALAESDLRAAIRRVYGEDATAKSLIAGLDAASPIDTRDDATPIDDLVHLANEAPVVRLVNLLLVEALDARASDVHLEAYATGLRVRYRVDGVLQEAPSPPANLSAAVISRLKIMAELDIAERRLPQDGRIRLKLQDRPVDVRVSTVPTLHGESVVLRLLDKERGRISLGELGMSAETLTRFKNAIARPHGIVLATGPTGSGKTTTLYAAVDLIRTGREKILTVEDPIEYQLGVPQVPVNDKIGVTFATALRALLRQDPDVMLVGEIRDAETAEIATQAALTGHLVLSTLHTNDAPSALTRLLELGVAGYLVASTVEAVLAQRLVRTICPACKQAQALSPGELREFGEESASIREVFRGKGCIDCRNTGYRGRVGIYELLIMSDEIRAAIGARTDSREIRRLMIASGACTLRRDGLRLVSEGTTTPEEVLRVSHE